MYAQRRSLHVFLQGIKCQRAIERSQRGGVILLLFMHSCQCNETADGQPPIMPLLLSEPIIELGGIIQRETSEKVATIKLECVDQRLEVGDWRLEVRSWTLRVECASGERRFKCAHIDVHIGRQSECAIVDDECCPQRLPQAVQCGAQHLLRRDAIAVGPEEREQLLARQRFIVRGEIVHQRAAFLARDGERLIVESNERRAEQLNGKHKTMNNY